MANDHYLEPTSATGNNAHFLYNVPNQALSAILVGGAVENLVNDYTAKVAATYIQRVSGRTKSGELLAGVGISVHIGGHRNDRWVGEVYSSAEYALADEMGRHESNPYVGSHDLRDSLYSILPQRI